MKTMKWPMHRCYRAHRTESRNLILKECSCIGSDIEGRVLNRLFAEYTHISFGRNLSSSHSQCLIHINGFSRTSHLKNRNRQVHDASDNCRPSTTAVLKPGNEIVAR